MQRRETDVLVVGSGIAGLTTALRVAEHADVLLVTKKARAETNTNYAQGGIAAVFDPGDSHRLHVRDTLLAGAGLCHREAVTALVREGPDRVRELMERGVRFSRGEEGLALGREGGHSRRRIVHAADLTGREIERALLHEAAGASRLEIREDHFLWSLRTAPDPRTGKPRCAGAVVLDVERETWVEVRCRSVVLATGGAGRLYRHTTNPPIATGDGVAAAYGAGAAVANMEFVQFHPTALYPATEQAFLISEAVRGEGAVLRGPEGERFVDAHHPAGSLAPRDVVARAIHAEMEATGAPHVWLDLSPVPARVLEERFPTITRRCREEGIDVPDERVPVVPAAHYFCGGVLTDAEGRTSLPGLYAAGETACTGVHGSNRLASNSLLEAVVYADRVSRRLEAALADLPAVESGPPSEPELSPRGRPPSELTEELRSLMWSRVGIVRSDAGLSEARSGIDGLRDRASAWDGTADGALRWQELRFMLRVAGLVVRSAAWRQESRGLHHNRDHPHRNSERFLRDTVLLG